MDPLTFILGLFVAIVPIILLWLNLRSVSMQATLAAKVAADAAKAAVKEAGVAALAAADTSLKLDEVRVQLDGRLTEFLERLDERVADAFQRGHAAGAEKVINAALATGQAKIQAHLEEQDAKAAERHDEAVGPTAKDGTPHKRREND